MMSKRLFLSMLVLLLALLTACGAEPTATLPPTQAVQTWTASPQPTDTPLPPTDTLLPPTDIPSPTPVPVPVFEEADCPFDLPAGQVDGRTVECGYLEVLEDRADPVGRADSDSAMLRLAVAIFRHPDGDPEPDPVIYLEGGPGGSALEFASLSFGDLSAPIFAANRDLILFDQRGVGLSEPALDCPALTELSVELLDNEMDGEELTYQEMDDLYLETALACGEELRENADLSDYNSDASAADVDDLRRALGYDQVNLWGISYGTRLALEVIRDYPEGVRSVVLDSVVPPDVDTEVEGPANVARALDLLFASCAADEACNAAYPDLRAVFFDIVDRLNESPAAFPVTDALTGEVYDAIMNGDDMLGLLAQSLYQTDIIPMLPQIIYDASEGSYELLARIAGSLLAVREGMSDGMQYSVQCNEEVSFSSATAFEAALGAETPIVRTMPNTPAMVGRGITGICGNPRAGAEGLAMATALMQAVGEVVELDGEEQIDAVTAVSGSGPAYVFHLIEALAAAGVAEGLPEAVAKKLARATVCGAGELAYRSPDSAEQLRINVTSPGGTTAAALAELMDPQTGLPPLMVRAVHAAAERGRDLAK